MTDERPNGYPDTYKTAHSYRRAKVQRGYYWDDEMSQYRHFHTDGTDAEFTVCLCKSGRLDKHKEPTP